MAAGYAYKSARHSRPKTHTNLKLAGLQRDSLDGRHGADNLRSGAARIHNIHASIRQHGILRNSFAGINGPEAFHRRPKPFGRCVLAIARAHVLIIPLAVFAAARTRVRLNCRGRFRLRNLFLADPGEMAEWLKAHAWKACIGETLSRVRIPLSPPVHPGYG